MNEMNAWDLIIENRFEEACQKADRDYHSEPARYSHLYNKVLALLNQRKYEDVIQLCLFLIEADNRESSSDFKNAGISHWFLNQHEKAVEMWRQSKDTKYRDAAGGVQTPLILLFAAIKLRDTKLEKEAFALLKKRSKSKMMINWPGPLANYMLNEIEEDALLLKINPQPSLYARQSCQTYFYMALKRLKIGDEAGYFELLSRSVSFDPVSRLEPEYYLAKGELAQAGK